MRLWRGFHHPELPELIAYAWEFEELLILCPPVLPNHYWIESLPAESIEFRGDWREEDQKVLKEIHAQPKKTSPSFPEKPVFGVFTSGTLNRNPRLVLYSKANIQTSIDGVLSFFDRERIQSVFSYAQPFHTFGLVLGYVMSFLKGFALHAPTGRYGRTMHEAWFEQTGTGCLTLGTPTHFYDLVEWTRAQNKTPAASYSCIIGGAPVPKALWEKTQSILKIEAPSIGYGCTEASPGLTHLAPGLKPDVDAEIGHPLPATSFELREDGVRFEGTQLCMALLQEGDWIFPKALTVPDELALLSNGRYVFKNRLGLVLNRGGAKYSLEHIENTLQAELGAEVIAVALPDARLGEDLGLLVEAGANFSRIQTWLKTRFSLPLPPTHFKTLDALPLNLSGKKDRARALTELTHPKKVLLEFPLPVSKLGDWLPHRPPMVWVDEVVEITAETGVCAVTIQEKAGYYGESGVRETAPIEWMAQSYGFIKTAQALSGFIPLTDSPNKAYLVAVKGLSFEGALPRAGERATIHIGQTRQVGPLSLFEGIIKNQAQHVVCRAQVKVYAE
jgi:hypothetical protein